MSNYKSSGTDLDSIFIPASVNSGQLTETTLSTLTRFNIGTADLYNRYYRKTGTTVINKAGDTNYKYLVSGVNTDFNAIFEYGAYTATISGTPTVTQGITDAAFSFSGNFYRAIVTVNSKSFTTSSSVATTSTARSISTGTSDLAANTAYSYTITPKNYFDTTGTVYSSTSNFTTNSLVPSISTATISAGSPALTVMIGGFTGATNCTKVNIKIQSKSGTTYTDVANTDITSITNGAATYTFTGLTNGNTYKITCTPYNGTVSGTNVSSGDKVTTTVVQLLFYYRFMSNDSFYNPSLQNGTYSYSRLYNWASGAASTIGDGVSENSINPVQNFLYSNVNNNTGGSTVGASVIFGGSNISTIESTSFTIAFWFNSLNSNGDWIFSLQSKAANDSTNEVTLSLVRKSYTTTGNYMYDRWTATNYSDSVITYNTWHHFAIVCTSGSPVKYYFDGALVTSTTTYTWTGSLTTNRFSLGYGTNSNNGIYADARFYKGELTQSDITTLSSSSYSVLTGTLVTDLGAYNIIPWYQTTPDTAARWIWNDANGASSVPINVYLNFFRAFYSSTSYSAIAYAVADNYGTFYFNGVNLGKCDGGWNGNGNIFTVSVVIGYNTINIFAYNGGTVPNAAGLIFTLYNGTNYVLNTNNLWKYVDWPAVIPSISTAAISAGSPSSSTIIGSFTGATYCTKVNIKIYEAVLSGDGSVPYSGYVERLQYMGYSAYYVYNITTGIVTNMDVIPSSRSGSYQFTGLTANTPYLITCTPYNGTVSGTEVGLGLGNIRNTTS